jgi:hypothetical protein
MRKKLLPFVNVVWRFDHSSNHKAKAENAKNAYRMNIGPGGKNVPSMRSTIVLDEGSLLYNKEQHLVFQAGDKTLDGKPVNPNLICKCKGLV